MEIKVFSQVLSFLNEDQEVKHIHLVEGELLKGKHSFLHSADETALYHFGNITEIYSDLTRLLKKQAFTIPLTWIEKLEDKWIKVEITGQNYEAALKHKKEGFIYFPVQLENASIIAFRELVAHLRAPDGCPWDREQTHQTLKANLLEETYEVLDAIDSGIPDAVQEELGDLLLQIVLHAQIASEADQFTISDVINGIHKKTTFRHPHVFKDLEVEGVDNILHNWEILKSQERENNHTTKESILDSIPRDLPALALAQKYQERAARVGFDWPEIEPVLDKVIEEINEFRQAEDQSSRESELGDLLFALVNVIRWSELDAESALRKMTKRFYTRFKMIEKKAVSKGQKIADLSLEEMDKYWDLAKDEESNRPDA